MKKVTASDFKVQCSRLMNEIHNTREHVLITKRGRPWAKLVPAGKPQNVFGCLKGVMEIVGDIESPIVPAEQWEALKD